MTHNRRTVFADDDLVELLADEPQLLAIADALVATRRTSHPRRRLAGAAGGIAAAAAVLLWLLVPGRGAPDVVEQALAAVGSQPVLHVAIEGQRGDVTLVELETGAAIRRTIETEIWFDDERDLKKTINRLDGEVIDELLETPEGGFTRGGIVYTCEWIAAHPAEAAKARVSCPDGPPPGYSPLPTLDTALSAFVDAYRSALAAGELVEAGEGEIDGYDVVWLEPTTGAVLDRVAVDASTYQPVAVEWRHGRRFRVTTAETVSYDAGLFEKPRAERIPIPAGVLSEAEVSAEKASAALGQAPLWLGEEWNGFRLVSLTMRDQRVRFADEPELVKLPTIKLSYERTTGDAEPREIDLYVTTGCLIRVGWKCSSWDPDSEEEIGFAIAPDSPALVRRGGLYVAIWAGLGDSHGLTLQAARALRPVNVN